LDETGSNPGRDRATQPKDIERAQAAGFGDYRTEPIDFVSFLGSIDGWMDKVKGLAPGPRR